MKSSKWIKGAFVLSIYAIFFALFSTWFQSICMQKIFVSRIILLKWIFVLQTFFFSIRVMLSLIHFSARCNFFFTLLIILLPLRANNDFWCAFFFLLLSRSFHDPATNCSVWRKSSTQYRSNQIMTHLFYCITVFLLNVY